MKPRVLIGVTLALGWALAQQNAQQPAHLEGARELFYVAAKSKDPLPPMRRPSSQIPNTPPPATPAAAAVHLGLRYNLILVDPNTSASREVDPETVLNDGGCFAIDLLSNRSGYLYVLAKQSSGQWQPLIPSPEMPDESNVIEPAKKVRVPSNYCFEVHAPAGSETLFVVLSRDPSDTYELYESIKRQANPPAPSGPVRVARPELLRADAGDVGKAVAHMTQMFGTRDIVIRKVDQPVAAAEPAHAVYVVNASDKPSSSVATQIVVRHK
jgi:hypothetical protein